jgi:hypothetical protein
MLAIEYAKKRWNGRHRTFKKDDHLPAQVIHMAQGLGALLVIECSEEQ